MIFDYAFNTGETIRLSIRVETYMQKDVSGGVVVDEKRVIRVELRNISHYDDHTRSPLTASDIPKFSELIKAVLTKLEGTTYEEFRAMPAIGIKYYETTEDYTNGIN